MSHEGANVTALPIGGFMQFGVMNSLSKSKMYKDGLNVTSTTSKCTLREKSREFRSIHD